MTINNFNNYSSIKSYFYSVSNSIQKLIEERDEKRTSISKELVAKIKSARKINGRSYLIYYALSKYNYSNKLSNYKFSTYVEEDIHETIQILAPIQAEVGFTKEDHLETSIEKSFGYALAIVLSIHENILFENLEKKFLDLLSSPKSQLPNRLYSMLSILKDTSLKNLISWPQLYLDVYDWEKNRSVQNNWAIDFYKNLRSENRPT